MKASDFFVKVGATLWIILAGVTVILLLLHWLGAFDSGNFEWKGFAIIFGVGGLIAFVIAAAVGVWESD